MKLIDIDALYTLTLTYRETDKFDIETYNLIRQQRKNPEVETYVVWSGDDNDWERKTYKADVFWLIVNGRRTRVAEITTENDKVLIGFIEGNDVYTVKGRYVDIKLTTDSEGLMNKPELLKAIFFCDVKNKRFCHRREPKNV